MSYNTSLINAENILLAASAAFEDAALAVFHYQYENNAIYRQYCMALHTNVASVKKITQIPFLPVSFFKSHKVVSGYIPDDALVFESSKTGGDTPSRHYIRDTEVYERSLLNGFKEFYGDPSQYTILALLPSYLERQNASLVYMAKILMEHSGQPDNGFYINEWEQLHSVLLRLEEQGKKVLLIGVTFALLDFADDFPMKLSNTIVMETGGMKGRREELTRTEVHGILKQHWQLNKVHSEYGMTELLSQAYATSDGIFKCTGTMRVLVRDINDPLEINETGNGCLNIVDIANIHSCSFIATEDLGIIHADGGFEVLGRMDHSALRGCSLMVV